MPKLTHGFFRLDSITIPTIIQLADIFAGWSKCSDINFRFPQLHELTQTPTLEFDSANPTPAFYAPRAQLPLGVG
jgi:hypothetical protein